MLRVGGGGLAIVYALLQEGVKEIVITNRSQERAETIADIFKDQNVSVRPWAGRHSLVTESDLIVNTTNQGMAGQMPLDLSLELAQPKAIVADIIYVPLETSLIKHAKSRGSCVRSADLGCCCINHDPHGSLGSESTPR